MSLHTFFRSKTPSYGMFGFMHLKISLLKKFEMHWQSGLDRMEILRLFTVIMVRNSKVFQAPLISNSILLILALNYRQSQRASRKAWYQDDLGTALPPTNSRLCGVGKPNV
jgi:hypothetical protein